MLLGTLREIRRYPVKSLRGESLEHAEIWEGGVRGDRVRQLVVQDGHARVGRPYRGMEHERLHLAGDQREAFALARERGVTLRAEDGERFYYSGAISLIFDRWLDGVSAHVGYPVEFERFRPNFFARAGPGFVFDEGSLVGKTLDVGEVRLFARKPISRCVTITYHPRGEAPDPRILRYVAQERDATMGLYCDVLRAGTARKGDSLFLVER
jgi:uncharacterized protein YcbX